MKGVVQEDAPDSGYGCLVTNRFGQLFEDESDPFDIIQRVQVENPKPKKKEDPKKPVGKGVKKGSQRDRRTALPVAGDGDHVSGIKSLPGKISLTLT